MTGDDVGDARTTGPTSRTYDGERPQRLADVVPGDAHRLRPDVDAGPSERGGHHLRLVVLEHGARDDAEPDRLAVDEVAAGYPLEVVEDEVLDALDVARVPAGVVERRAAPAMGVHERPDPRLGALADLVEARR